MWTRDTPRLSNVHLCLHLKKYFRKELLHNVSQAASCPHFPVQTQACAAPENTTKFVSENNRACQAQEPRIGQVPPCTGGAVHPEPALASFFNPSLQAQGLLYRIR